MGIGRKVKEGRRFILEDLWEVELEELGHIKRKVVQSLRIVILTIRTFGDQKIGFQSVALSFFCTMAVVPFISVALALTKGLGLSDKIEAMLHSYLPSDPQIVSCLMTYADNILMKASSSFLGFISAAFFVWLVIWMMLCVEKVFNNVWMVDQNRSFATRFWRDIAIIVIAPFLILLLYGSAILMTGVLHLNWVKWIIIYVSSTLTFSAMYKFIPNTDVRYRYALRAALFSGFAFTIIQAVYVGSQIFITRLSGIYGAIAAIPFFMFWLNFSWYVILVGAELSYAFQNIYKYETVQ